MRRQAGVENFLNLRMGVEMARHGDAIGVVLEHANRKRLDAARDEEAIHGRKACTRRALEETNFFCIVRAREDHHASGRAAAAFPVLCHRMPDLLSPSLYPPLQHPPLT